MHLHERLPFDALARAAFGGLQDSAPRAALVSLHARVDGVEPSSWEHELLAQVWFRGADYVVPRDDVALFTLGASPRDPGEMAAIERLAGAVLRVLGGRPRSTREVSDALGLETPNPLRRVCVTGRLRIRWDASRIDLIPVERPEVDADEARIALARRFLTWLGPATPVQFARWAAVAPADAAVTWEGLGPELAEVDVEGSARSMLAGDAVVAAPVAGVRLLPLFDPYLAIDKDLLEPASRLPLPPVGGDVTQRLLNSLAGRILLDGEVVGAWGRVQHKVTLLAWRALSPGEVERIDAEASLLQAPIGRPVAVRWLRG